MMLVLGRCLLLVVVAIDVSDACSDCSAAAADVDVGEGDLTLLFDVSSPPSSPPRCDDDVLCCIRCCCFLSRMSAMMLAVVLPFS